MFKAESGVRLSAPPGLVHLAAVATSAGIGGRHCCQGWLVWQLTLRAT